MSTATMELADPTPITPPPPVNRKSVEPLDFLFDLSERVIAWMQSRKDRVKEAYLTHGPSGWNLYIHGNIAAYDFPLSDELSQFVLELFDETGEYVDPRSMPLSGPEEMQMFFNPSRALRLSPG